MTQIYIKQNIHKHRTQNFRRISPFGITPVKKKKKHIRLRHPGIVDHSVDLSIPDFLKKSIKKEWTEAIKNLKILYKCITANTSAIWQHKKAHLLTKNTEEFSGKSSEERTSRQKKIRQKE